MSDWPAVSPGLPIERAPVETAASLSERYDAAWLPAILEHLYEPAPVLQRVHAALVPGGLVFIDVPNECGLWQRVGNLYMALRGRRWAVNLSPTFPPFHVVGFCPRSLRLLLARCGFEVLSLRTHRWQNELPPSGTLWRRAERAAADVVLTIGAKAGAGAGITCWARKPQ
jgi:SAM-dependent methyltransferase